MVTAESAYETCRELFTSYPAADVALGDEEAPHSMVLMLTGDEILFFVLTCDQDEEGSVFTIGLWCGDEISSIKADENPHLPGIVVDVITRGIPIPKHGSLFGWKVDGRITALVTVHTEYTPDRPFPSWAVMPRVDAERKDWPPFTHERLFGSWFWENYAVEQVVSLEKLVADAPDSVFWLDTNATLGSDCCLVARDIESREGYTLSRGRYIYHQCLQSDIAIPSFSNLLARADKIDLASRFTSSTQNDGEA